ncbi:hypothetical protein Spico_1787 [Parasphaerochaeta coccoides DSM 17374]|uniref:Uncharacterized protein n=1 Tax=Parasphaerochaeta coccoides (strain ATCC BAA-1237 / DSM 17374 / SPN1) TaxID=760011 RepID=F4GLU4_PARC1|nr:hypothetical protein Spico_1787 [Parasphaerochaeta coccoides DSM 17374]
MISLDSFFSYMYFRVQKENDSSFKSLQDWKLQNRVFSNLLLFPLRFNLLFLRGFFYKNTKTSYNS